MDNSTPPGSHFQHSRYLEELLAERQKLEPFMQVLPMCSLLINKEIALMSNLISDQGLPGHERDRHEYPFRSPSHQNFNAGPMILPGWPAMQTKAAFIGWNGIQRTPTVKRIVRLDIPIDKYPGYNLVGRVLGPRGNSLKRFEAMTGCRVYIRGRGSMKDCIKEEKLKDQPGYEHLNEPIHLLIEAEFPEDIIDARMDYVVSVLENLLKPEDEATDELRKQQLRELALLDGTLK